MASDYVIIEQAIYPAASKIHKLNIQEANHMLKEIQQALKAHGWGEARIRQYMSRIISVQYTQGYDQGSWDESYSHGM